MKIIPFKQGQVGGFVEKKLCLKITVKQELSGFGPSGKKNYYNNIALWWDIGKNRLKEIIKDYEITKKYKINKVKRQIQERYDFLCNNPTLDNTNELNDIESKLKWYEYQEWEKAKLWLHNKQKVEGEKPSKYFFSAAKQQQNNAISFLQNDQGDIFNKPSSMLKHAHNFYSELFTSNQTNNFHMTNILNEVDPIDIGNEKATDMENDLSMNELFVALKEMARDKAPGMDGLTVEFYLKYWYIFKNDFMDVVNYCKTNMRLPRSMNLALVRLIFKNKGERENLRNWRPLSVLNVDYKIIAKALNKRLSKIMLHLIKEEQTCGLKGRNIQLSLMTIRDTIDYINLNNGKAAIVNIDQEKAFDRIEWRYMYAMMERMGIPANFIDWIKVLYSNPLATVNINNFFTQPIKITRGIRQGCPRSPSLYAICAKGLANLIRNNNCIKGVQLPMHKASVKIIQHADDISIFITDPNDFHELNTILYTYSEGSGSKINKSKTKGLWLGRWKSKVDGPGNFIWSRHKFKILGVFFGNEVDPEENWDGSFNKIKNVLNRWKGRSLTMKGRAIVVNSLVGSMLSYYGSIISCLEHLKKKNLTILFGIFTGSENRTKLKEKRFVGLEKKVALG